MPPVAMAEVTSNGTVNTEGSTPVLNTMPGEDFSWKITLSEKVIASKSPLLKVLNVNLHFLTETKVTGANRGIGIGIAQVCLANSAKAVYSLDLMEPGEDFFALQKRFPNFHYIQTDVTSEDSIEKAVDQVVEETGRIDGMVANAGTTKHQPALKFDREELDKLFQLNVSCQKCYETVNWIANKRALFFRYMVHTSALRLLREGLFLLESKAQSYSHPA